jgi:hypothetical protein
MEQEPKENVDSRWYMQMPNCRNVKRLDTTKIDDSLKGRGRINPFVFVLPYQSIR